MKIKLVHFATIFLLALFLYNSSHGAVNSNNQNSTKESKNISRKHHNLQMGMRKLWIDHIVWTRNFIISSLADLPDKDAVTTRLLNNQKDIGDAIKPFYGEEASLKLTKLLTQHILTAADIVTAAKSGNSEKVTLHSNEWYKNADEIALFLNQANPKHWALADLQLMMHEHLKLTTDELMARLNKNWEDDVVAYNKIHEEILMMSDMLSEGIIKQFPKHKNFQ